MSDILIAIPSYKRAGEAIAANVFKNAKLFVHSFEADEYRKHYGDRVVEIPDELQKKGMAVIRNYILDNSPNKVLMVDDDVSGIFYHEEGLKHRLLDVDEFIADGFRMAEELGTNLWGINLNSDRQSYREFSPISLTSPILGTFMGVIGKEIRFDERLGLKEDYDFFIQSARRYRKVLRLDKYYYTCDHLKKKGGCTSYRTKGKEQEQLSLLIKKWGSRIVKAQGTTNPIITLPI